LQAVRRVGPAQTSGGTGCVMLDEALNLFSEALFRLKTLDSDDPAHFWFDRRAAARPTPAHHA
jgi:hypothetical protein